jgi:hypothetical protein
MIVKKEVHTKCATSRRLSKALKDLVGQEAHFKVEVITPCSVKPRSNFANQLSRCDITSTTSSAPSLLTL